MIIVGVISQHKDLRVQFRVCSIDRQTEWLHNTVSDRPHCSSIHICVCVCYRKIISLPCLHVYCWMIIINLYCSLSTCRLVCTNNNHCQRLASLRSFVELRFIKFIIIYQRWGENASELNVSTHYIREMITTHYIMLLGIQIIIR